MLAVAGGKGGCGKTTTTVGLALAAARGGRSVLAVDADVDVPDLHRVAGVEPQEDGDGLGALPVPCAPAVGVLPATTQPDPNALPERVAAAGPHDLVLVDCPAGAGRDAAVPLRHAERTLLVTTARPASLRDAAKTGAMSRAVGTPVAGAVVTRTDRVPAAVDRLLDAGVTAAVPGGTDPLSDPATVRRFLGVLRRLSAV